MMKIISSWQTMWPVLLIFAFLSDFFIQPLAVTFIAVVGVNLSLAWALYLSTTFIIEGNRASGTDDTRWNVLIIFITFLVVSTILFFGLQAEEDNFMIVDELQSGKFLCLNVMFSSMYGLLVCIWRCSHENVRA